MSDIFFEIYRRLLPTHPRLIKSNHAETFHSNFPPRWPQNLKVLLFLNARASFCGLGVAVSWDYSDITICNHLVAHQRSRFNSCQSPLQMLQASWNHPPRSFSSHVARPRKLFTFVYLKFDICARSSGATVNRNNSCDSRVRVKKEKGSKKKRARQSPRVI